MDYEKAKLRAEVDTLTQQVRDLTARVETLERPPVVAEPEPKPKGTFWKKKPGSPAGETAAA